MKQRCWLLRSCWTGGWTRWCCIAYFVYSSWVALLCRWDFLWTRWILMHHCRLELPCGTFIHRNEVSDIRLLWMLEGFWWCLVGGWIAGGCTWGCRSAFGRGSFCHCSDWEWCRESLWYISGPSKLPIVTSNRSLLPFFFQGVPLSYSRDFLTCMIIVMFRLVICVGSLVKSEAIVSRLSDIEG